MLQKSISVNIPIAIFREGDTFIAHSPVLDISTSAPTFEAVKRRFSELVEIFFAELIDMGTLTQVLSDLGWVKYSGKWTPPMPIANELTHVNVPIVN